MAAAILALTAAPAVAQGTLASGDWLQFQADAAHAGSVPDGPQPAFRQAWRFDPGLSGRFGVSAPVIAGDLVVTVAPHAVYGMELATGQQRWLLDRDFGPSVPPAIARDATGTVLLYTEGFGANPPAEAFPSSTPSPSSPGTAPTPSTSEAGSDAAGAAFDSRVVAVDLTTRRPVWDAPVQLEAVSRTGVTVEGSGAYVGDDDGTVTAIDLASGAVEWTYDGPGPVVTPIGAAEGTLVLSTQPRPGEPAVVIALDRSDGSERWRFQPTTLPFIATVPAIAGDAVTLGFSDQTGSRARALALADGTPRWETAANSQFSPLTSLVPTATTVIAVDAYGQAYALDPSEGEPVWDYALNTVAVRSVPVLIGSSLLVPTDGGELVAIDVDSHQLVARTAGSGPRGYLGPMAVAARLVVAVKGGHHPGLVAFEHDPDAPLLSIASPTVLALGPMMADLAIALLPLLLLLGLGGRWLHARLGPAFADEGPQDGGKRGDRPEAEPG
ncbi:MAG: PQQ-binding-like beta-propeller repeat protein [Actinobacteria bacterium]|nr:PQQ-binding-like beta-propeller repeat protein [Actinomycetota bacterium]